MTISEKIEAAIEKHPKWKTELYNRRAILQESELTEDIKWRAPAYLLDKKIVIGFMGFKNHYGIWFHQGVFLKDKANVLINAQEGKTKAMRMWKFYEGDTVDESLLKAYVTEAIQNTIAGKEVKSAPIVVATPPLLEEAFKNNPALKQAFNKLSPGKQKDYNLHIADAKQEKTKLKRLEKIIPMILENKGLHDKYKNC
jgi:uncharacterized protein YdeI (YjbR/CyaY-like superfamily)